ncbi:1-aminocyclopropane-1-carboxylate oxidase 1-like [Juglans microcarpa x Juglans regia]|uniref:1-aminocyclopropane-1-carboxylate oxidase 1-like n=1 Tax=Juglans microcarpa x Juglans regia TaxID=2249226 RepID=UPI001B7F0798|nr:1-aminocyclopropane-1-carboxylate oxidase 1-like [Juglans microcarpa x Juglans regia]
MEEDKGCFHQASFNDQKGRLRISRVPVVQELARQGLHYLPDKFIKLRPDQPTTPSLVHEFNTFPSINMAKLRLGSEPEGRAHELAKLASGAQEWGMFLITDHGMPADVLHDVKDVVKGFFGLSFEEKKASVGSYASVDNMGYGRNFVKSEDQPLDWIDRLTMKAAPEGATEGLHVWPQKPNNFRQAIEQYVKESRKVFNDLLDSLAESLSLERHVFVQYFHHKDSEVNVRVNYYPPCPRPDLALGITPHTDASALTLLMEFDTTGGLQVLRDRKWVAVPWPRDTLLVNVGDILEIMSNGRLKSPWHRVVTQMDADRFSIALFYNPPSRAEIEPVRINATMEHEVYKKVALRDYLQHFYKINPTSEKQAIDFAKVQ